MQPNDMQDTQQPEPPAPETSAPAPAPETPTPPPVAPAPVAAPQAPTVVQQYVVTERSLDGLGGWLIFFMIFFGIVGLGSIMVFALTLANEDASSAASRIVTLIFSPLSVISYLGATVLIALKKKLAVLVSASAIGISALYGAVNGIVGIVNGSTGDSTVVAVAGILVGVLLYSLVALYFFVSKRVKQTLVN